MTLEVEEIREMLALSGYEDWEVSELGDFVCPHGITIEPDGECPQGCPCPLLEMGLI